MLVDWNALGIMGSIAGSVAGTAYFLGKKMGNMVTRDRCNGVSGTLGKRVDNINLVLSRIEDKIDGSYKEKKK